MDMGCVLSRDILTIYHTLSGLIAYVCMYVIVLTIVGLLIRRFLTLYESIGLQQANIFFFILQGKSVKNKFLLSMPA